MLLLRTRKNDIIILCRSTIWEVSCLTIREKRRVMRYSKPCMTNLRGKLGREIMQTIRETPRPSQEATRKKTEQAMENIKKQMILVELKNGRTTARK